MQDIEYGAYVYVTAPNYSFREKHGTIGKFEKADEASSLIWIKFEKDQETHSVEPEFVSRVRKRDEFASYMGEKVIINQTLINGNTNEVSYVIVYPDALRGSSTVYHHELTDWVEPEPTSDEVIADLTDHLYNVSKELDRYKNMYVTDMTHWERTMRDVKERQGWCDEGTNKVIAELNKGFMGWDLDYYEEEFEIEVEIRATIVTTTTVTVSATSEEAAAELVIDNPECYFDPVSELADAAQYVDDYEVDIA